MGGDEGGDRREDLALDPQPPQKLQILVGQEGELAGAVIHQADLNALFGLPGQNLQNLSPHLSLRHDKVLQENETLRPLQLPQHLGELVLPQREVHHLRPVIHRVAVAALDVPDQRRRPRILLRQPLIDCLRLRDALSGHGNELAEPRLQRTVPDVRPGVQVQQRPEHRRQHHHHQPRNLSGGIPVAVQQINHHDDREQNRAAEDMGPEFPEPLVDAGQERHLQQHQQKEQAHAAEHGADDAVLPLLQQTHPHILTIVLSFLHISPFVWCPRTAQIFCLKCASCPLFLPDILRQGIRLFL